MKLGPIALSPEWFEARRGMVTGTDVPGILGYSKWKSPLTIWERITGKYDPPSLEGKHLEYGNDTEEMHRKRLTRELGLENVDPLGCLVYHPDHDWFGVTPDGSFERNGKWALELKAPCFDLFAWNQGTPKAYRLQGLAAAMVLEAEGCLLSAWLPPEPKWAWLERTPAITEKIMGRLDRFWSYHVQRDIPPAPTGATMDAQALARINGEEVGRCVPLSPAGIRATRIVEELEPRIKKEDEILKRAKNVIRQEIGEAQFGTIVDGKPWSYRATAKTSRTLKRINGLPKGLLNG